MTEEEYALLCSKLKQTGVSQQAYIISAIKNVSVIPSDQLARIANSRNYAPGIRVLEKISREIAGYRKDSEEIWQSIRSLIAQQKATGR